MTRGVRGSQGSRQIAAPLAAAQPSMPPTTLRSRGTNPPPLGSTIAGSSGRQPGSTKMAASETSRTDPKKSTDEVHRRNAVDVRIQAEAVSDDRSVVGHDHHEQHGKHAGTKAEGCHLRQPRIVQPGEASSDVGPAALLHQGPPPLGLPPGSRRARPRGPPSQPQEGAAPVAGGRPAGSPPSAASASDWASRPRRPIASLPHPDQVWALDF